jgi:hypothetical protein
MRSLLSQERNISYKGREIETDRREFECRSQAVSATEHGVRCDALHARCRQGPRASCVDDRYGITHLKLVRHEVSLNFHAPLHHLRLARTPRLPMFRPCTCPLYHSEGRLSSGACCER